VGFSPFTPPLAPFKSRAATGVVAARTLRPKPSGRESPLRRCWTNGTQFTRNLQRNFPDALGKVFEIVVTRFNFLEG
jgi:hypothetical protein